MGEMADMFLDTVIDHEDMVTSWHKGEITAEEAYSLGIIDALGYEMPSGHMPIKYRKCRCCGEGGLRWEKLNEKWRLFKGSKLHVCPKNPLRESRGQLK